MKKTIFLGLVAVMFMAGIASALPVGVSSIDYNTAPVPTNGGYSSPYSNLANFALETFDNQSLLWTWSGSFGVQSGSAAGQNAAPAYFNLKDETNYVAVPVPNGQGDTATVTNLNGSYDYLGLWWGSMDTYNRLDLLDNGTVVATITGSDVVGATPPGANGDQISEATNRYVNIFTVLPFDSFAIISTQRAFEADNIAIANVPEPASMLLLGSGLVVLGLFGRRRKA